MHIQSKVEKSDGSIWILMIHLKIEWNIVDSFSSSISSVKSAMMTIGKSEILLDTTALHLIVLPLYRRSIFNK